MKNLDKYRDPLNMSDRAFIYSLGEPAPISLKRYRAIAYQGATPTTNERKTILALINVNRSERGEQPLVLDDLA